jgi:hypothetical protein
MYKPNPKLMGSGVIGAIPHSGRCTVGCKDCFFQSGRSYLEPLEMNLPNMPTLEDVGNQIVRVNDGNDSNNDPDMVMKACALYPNKFYNTSMPWGLEDFDAPVVLTVNPSTKTDTTIQIVYPIPSNLLYVRVRTNMWNLEKVVDGVVEYYAQNWQVPVLLTMMAYHDDKDIPEKYKEFYTYRKRTLNEYWALTKEGMKEILHRYKHLKNVYLCGNESTWPDQTSCKHCQKCKKLYNKHTDMRKPLCHNDQYLLINKEVEKHEPIKEDCRVQSRQVQTKESCGGTQITLC